MKDCTFVEQTFSSTRRRLETNFAEGLRGSLHFCPTAVFTQERGPSHLNEMGSPFQAAQAFCSSWALMVWGSHMGTLRARRPLLVNRVVTGALGVGKPSAEHRYLVSIRIYTLEYRFIEHSK